MDFEFDIGMSNLKKNNYDYFNKYNHYCLRRFFDNCLNDKNYINEIENIGTSFIAKEHLLIFFILSCINKEKNNNFLIKILYEDLLKIKKKNNWKGRMQWREFHSVFLSHFVWNKNYEMIFWILSILNISFKDKPKNTINKWRILWYKKEIKNMHLEIVKTAIISNNFDILSILLENLVVKETKSIKKLLLSYGYNIKDNNIIKAQFCERIEWKILKNIENITNIDILKIDLDLFIYLSKITKSDSKSILYLFIDIEKNNDFWYFILNLNEEYINYIKISNIILFIEENDYLLKNINNINKLYNIYDFILNKINIISVKFINILLKSGLKKININDGIDLILNYIRKHPNGKFEKLKKFTSNLINHEKINIINKNICVDEMYWMYYFFGKSIVLESLDEKINSNDNFCPICLDSINNDEYIKLTCGHIYHKSCVQKDYNYNKCLYYQCGLCRSKIHPLIIDL